MSSLRVRALLLALVVVLVATPDTVQAQVQPYRIEMVTRLLEAGVGNSVILERVQVACLAFPVDASAETRLARAGADAEFIAALRSTCVKTEPGAEPAPAPAPAGTDSAAARPPSQPARQWGTPVSTPPEASPAPRQAGNPWGGFRVRAIGYGVLGLASAGALTVGKTETSEFCDATDCYSRRVTTAPYKSIGMGGVAVAAGAAVADWMMTTRKARAARALALGSARPVLLRTPTVSPGETGPRVEIVRLAF